MRRAAISAVDAGAGRLLLAPDQRGLAVAAIAQLDLPADVETLDQAVHGDRSDTQTAAARLRDEGADVIVSLGGDGTHRDIALGWLDAPLVPISTGTNNAFPLLVDATLAGTAAGLLASSAIELAEVATTAKVLHIDLGSRSTLALVDAVLVDERFTGSRAVWRADSLRTIVAALADPAALGLSSVAGRLHSALPEDDHGVIVHCAPSATRTVRAPLVPGALSTVGVVEAALLTPGEEVTVEGPGLLALDGERDLALGSAEQATLVMNRRGPSVIDPWAAVRLAAARGLFTSEG